MFSFQMALKKDIPVTLKKTDSKAQVEQYLANAFETIKSWGYDMKGFQFGLQERGDKLSVTITATRGSRGGEVEIPAGPYEFFAYLSKVEMKTEPPSKEINGNKASLILNFTAPGQGTRTLAITFNPLYKDRALMDINYNIPGMKKQPAGIAFEVTKNKVKQTTQKQDLAKKATKRPLIRGKSIFKGIFGRSW